MTAAVHPPIAAQRFPRGAAVAGLIWLVLATIAGATGFLAQLQFPGGQLIILGATLAAMIAALTVLRPWLDTVPVRWLIGINAARFIGIAFLMLAAQGKLSSAFAQRAGWGDIAVAIGAIVFALRPAGRPVLHAWNALGFLDLVVAVGTATVVALQGVTPGIGAILAFPLSLVPTVAVPLFLANHVVIFRRLLRDGR
jgi:hypothetical protein